MQITHHEQLIGHSNDPSKPISKNAWVAAHDVSLIVAADIAPAAAILESQLSLNFPTHSNANDPTSDQKNALAGTSGIPSVSNPYVTNADSRNSDIRTPVTHTHQPAGVGGQLDHTLALTNIGSNTHAQLDTFLASKAAASGLASLDASSHVVQAGAVNPVTAGAANGLATLNASSLVVQDPANAVWIDYSSTSTVVGWSSFTTKVIKYLIINKIMFVNFELNGTSNSGTTSFTLPFAAVQRTSAAIYSQDAGAEPASPAQAYCNSIATVSLFKTFNSGAWTASGTKICSGMIVVQLA